VSALVLYFQVHQPYRLRRIPFPEVGRGGGIFDDPGNARILRRVAERCYVPATALLLRLVEEGGGRFRFAISVSGTALSQMERWCPAALRGFRALAGTGAVEFLAETSHHSLAFLADPAEFRAQVALHRERVESLLGVRPRTFRNTELAFDSASARAAEEMGFDAMLAEGADHLLGWRSPHAVYRPAGCRRLRLLLRAYRLSDDVAFRFSSRGWEGWPLSAAKFSRWLRGLPGDARVVGLFMDFETLGEHQRAGTGIFEFLGRLPAEAAAGGRFRFRTPAEAAAAEGGDPEPIDAPRPVSWADFERDLSAWLGNPMQAAAHGALYVLGPEVRRAAAAGRPGLLEEWRRLTTSDHFYYMSTKWSADGDVHRYFSPWPSPHDAYLSFLNALEDLALRAGAGAAAAPAGDRAP